MAEEKMYACEKLAYLRERDFKKAQSIVEYILTFVAIAIGVITVFGSFMPGRINIARFFNQAVDTAIGVINE